MTANIGDNRVALHTIANPSVSHYDDRLEKHHRLV